MFTIRIENGLRIATVRKEITIELLEKLFRLWKWDYLEYID